HYQIRSDGVIPGGNGAHARARLCGLRLHRGKTALHLLDGQPLFHFRNIPGVTEGIGDRAAARAVELVSYGRNYSCAGLDSSRDEGISVVHLELYRNGRPAQFLRTWEAVLGRLLAQHENRIADLDLGMGNLAPSLETHDLASPEGFVIKIDGRARIP